MLLKLEGSSFPTSLDINMVYYHVQVTPNDRCICMIIILWGEYEYCRLPMVVSVAPDIFR